MERRGERFLGVYDRIETGGREGCYVVECLASMSALPFVTLCLWCWDMKINVGRDGNT